MPQRSTLGWNVPLDRLADTPARALAYELLRHLPANTAFVRIDKISDALELAGARKPDGVIGFERRAIRRANPDATLALVEGFAELERLGLVVAWPPPTTNHKEHYHGGIYQLTRLGREIQQHDNPSAALDARRRLGVDLHPRLAKKLRAEVAVGAFESATLTALRAVEARVRDLTGTPLDGRGNRLTGVPLMQHALRPGGPLADPDASPGEQLGVMQLFTGSFGAVRNLLAHTEVEWPDPTEAAEYVLLADLLMRILDRAEARSDGSTG